MQTLRRRESNRVWLSCAFSEEQGVVFFELLQAVGHSAGLVRGGDVFGKDIGILLGHSQELHVAQIGEHRGESAGGGPALSMWACGVGSSMCLLHHFRSTPIKLCRFCSQLFLAVPPVGQRSFKHSPELSSVIRFDQVCEFVT